MRVSHLSLTNYRNYRQVDVSFMSGLNVLVGRNGQGKTNLVEAINYFANLQSHRVITDKALILSGESHSIMRMSMSVGEREALLEIQLNASGANRSQINRNKVPNREIPRWFSSVIFAPEDLLLVRGEPGVRRKFFDSAYALLFPSHRSVVSDFERVLRQRNALLRTMRGNLSASNNSMLTAWDEQYVELASKIISARRELTQFLAVPISLNYNNLVDADHRVSMEWVESLGVGTADVSRETSAVPGGTTSTTPSLIVSRETIKDQLRAKLEATRRNEVSRGTTVIGPHRDEVLFSLNKLPIKGYASHGETWSFALAIRLAQAEIIRNYSPAGDPVIILDDVFAELDSSRRKKLMSNVLSFEQVIVTAAVESDIPSPEIWDKKYVQAGLIS